MSDKPISVLVFPCGSENGIEIHAALKDTVNIRLFGASGKEDHGAFVYKNYFGHLPYINESNFIKCFNSILTDNTIDVVMPTHDDVALFLALNKDNIKAKIAVPGIQQAIICRSKTKTYEFFKQDSFTPRTYKDIKNVKKFPVFAKPDQGQGGKNSFLILDKKTIKNKGIIKKIIKENYIITEYLPGDESTVDCFTDRHGQLKFIGPRRRNRIFCGISANSSTQPLTDEIKSIANTINEKMKMRGLWFFQIKKDYQGEYKLMEISVRTAGTMNLYRALGVNFPLLTVYDLMGYDIEILCNNYDLVVDRALFNRYKANFYYHTVYIDLDDTITKNGSVNPRVIYLLYHLKNMGKTIILLTRHNLNLDETLQKLILPKELFDEIIQLTQEEPKYNRIKETKASIFIDNSFKERAEVVRNLKIPVFDVDAINSLIDWRE